MRGKVVCIAAVLFLVYGGLVFAQAQQTENQQFRSDLNNSNDTGAQKHETVVQHRAQQHQENVAHRVDHKAEWEKKMAERRAERERRVTERRVAREKHMAELRAEREKRIAERKARFHQHHTTQSGESAPVQPQ